MILNDRQPKISISNGRASAAGAPESPPESLIPTPHPLSPPHCALFVLLAYAYYYIIYYVLLVLYIPFRIHTTS